MFEAALNKPAPERGNQQEEWREQMTDEMMVTPRNPPDLPP